MGGFIGLTSVRDRACPRSPERPASSPCQCGPLGTDRQPTAMILGTVPVNMINDQHRQRKEWLCPRMRLTTI
jgi:hypothetical protein